MISAVLPCMPVLPQPLSMLFLSTHIPVHPSSRMAFHAHANLDGNRKVAAEFSDHMANNAKACAKYRMVCCRM
jgi:hypothetical protein